MTKQVGSEWIFLLSHPNCKLLGLIVSIAVHVPYQYLHRYRSRYIRICAHAGAQDELGPDDHKNYVVQDMIDDVSSGAARQPNSQTFGNLAYRLWPSYPMVIII